MTPGFDDFAALVPPFLAGFLVMVEGYALDEGVGWIHRLGIPIGEGEGELVQRQPDDAELVRLGPDELGYWSTRVRLGKATGSFRRSAMGILCTGTLSADGEGRRTRWVERVRLSPVFLVGAVSFAGIRLWAGAPPQFLVLPPIFFGLFYSAFCVAGVAETRRVRRHLLGS